MYKGPPHVREEDSGAVQSTGCLYCNEPLGERHKPSCIVPKRTVVMEYTVTIVDAMPENYSINEIDHYHGGTSSWCAGNLVSTLAATDDASGCLCPNVVGRYVREATKEDEDALGWPPRGGS